MCVFFLNLKHENTFSATMGHIHSRFPRGKFIPWGNIKPILPNFLLNKGRNLVEILQWDKFSPGKSTVDMAPGSQKAEFSFCFSS